MTVLLALSSDYDRGGGGQRQRRINYASKKINIIFLLNCAYLDTALILIIVYSDRVNYVPGNYIVQSAANKRASDY